MIKSVHHKYNIPWIIAFAGWVVFLTACNISTTQMPAAVTPTEEVRIFNSASYITITSLGELADQSTLIVVGKAIRTGDIINMARDVYDLSKPDPHLYGIGQIYEFEVVRYLKGAQDTSNAKSIDVVQVEGIIHLLSQTPPIKNDIEKARVQEKYNPIGLGSEYILFLESLVGFPELKMHYTGIAQPWRFIIVNDCVFPDSPWEGVGQYYYPETVEKFIKRIENARTGSNESPEQTGYPAPIDEKSSVCSIEPVNDNVYP